MKSKSFTVAVAIVAIFGGLSLQTYQLVFLSDGPMNSFLLGLIAWSIAPYIICGVILFGFHRSWPSAIGSFLVLAADLAMHHSVFIKPAGSTAAVGLVFMPIVNLAFILPVGLLIGWFVSRSAKTNAL